MPIKTFCFVFFVMAVFFSVLPHFIANHWILKLKTEVAIRQHETKKNLTPKKTLGEKILVEDIRVKQLLLLQLFTLMSQSPIRWLHMVNQKENMLLKGQALNFSELKKFLQMCRKEHISFSLQKMQVNESVEFQLIILGKNHGAY